MYVFTRVSIVKYGTNLGQAYVVYFLITLPFHWIHPRYLKWFFDIKTIVCLPGIFALLGWVCHISDGGLHTTLFLQRTSLRGAQYSWAFLGALNVSSPPEYQVRF